MRKIIFVLSSARSGTTSLCNHLCQHSEIFGLQAKEHYGIMEFKFMAELRYFFDNLTDEVDYFTFLNIFTQSDLFRASGLSADIFLKNKQKNIFSFVNFFVKETLKNSGKSYWINNCPKQSFYIKDLLKLYPNAYYLHLKRPLLDTVKSNTRKFTGKRFLGFAQKVFRYQTDHIPVANFKTKIKNFHEIKSYDYDKGRWNFDEEALRNVITFLNLEWDSKILLNPYKTNSSFDSSKEKKVFFGCREQNITNLCEAFFNFLPFNLLRMPIRRNWDLHQLKKSNSYPFNFRLHKDSSYFQSKNFHLIRGK